MQCRNSEIQELLPAYAQELLDGSDRSRVEQHLASCGECARELAMISMLAGEPVPDPGEAFWSSLPGKVYREIRETEQQRRSRWLTGLLDRLSLPRWAWAGAASGILIAVVVTWFMLRPGPVEVANTAHPDRMIPLSEDMLDAGSIDLAQLDDVQLGSLDSWASRELAEIHDSISDLFTNGLDASLDDQLAELDAQELQQLSNELDEYEEEG